MGGSKYQYWHRSSVPISCERAYVNAQKNIYHALYPELPTGHTLDWRQPYHGYTYSANISAYAMINHQHVHSNERNSYSGMQRLHNPTSQNHFQPYLSYVTSQTSHDQSKVSPRPSLDFSESNGSFLQEQFQNSNLNQLHVGAVYNSRVPGQYPVMPTPHIHNLPLYSMVYDPQQTISRPIPSPTGTISTVRSTQQGDNHKSYSTETNSFYHELSGGSGFQTNYSQKTYGNGQDVYDSVTQYGNPSTSPNHLNIHNSTQSNNLAENKIEIIQQTSLKFVETFCPMLGKRPYCFPPIKRHMHQDKQLVLGMESENRVLGSFEKYFAERQNPVFMLCHYPVSGFMQIFQGRSENLDRDPANSKVKSGNDTITLLLLSDLFSLTVVTVCIISGNSDLTYIQRGVHKALVYNKRCADAVIKWLKFLGIRPEVRQVIAFPNLKRAMLNRIRKEKQFLQNYDSLCTLHADDLPAPFEEEWPSEGHKQLFNLWMQKNILCHTPTLSIGELYILVGALLSPRLSKADFVHDEKTISPIVESTHSSVPSQPAKEDVSKLQLTIGGLTKPFDMFMDEYVKCYYPDLENRTFRVPPIHFNIQSLKTPSDYFKAMKENSETCTLNGCHVDCKTKKCANSPFMPPGRSLVMTATRSSCNKQTGPVFDSQIFDSSSYKSRRFLDAQESETLSLSSACLESLQDVKVLSDVMTKDIRADEGENRVISVFEMLGNHFEPMFIICGYQYNNYLNKLREEMFSKEDTKRPVRAFGQTMRAEHDCLIFHKKHGAIIVCIKAVGDNFEDWSASEEQKISCTKKILEKAMKQLEREEAMIRHVTSDLQANLACHKLIALPNMTRESVEKTLNADENLRKTIKEFLNHGAEMFLCSDELPPQHQPVWDYYENPDSLEKLKNWWKNAKKFFNNDKNKGITSQIYRQLVGRYCGLFSTVEVWSPTNARVEVRSTSEAVSVCAARFRKMILLPHQIKALCSNDRHVYLYGPPGSGKTLILTLKAKEWLLAGESVILINSRPESLHGFPYAYGVFQKLRQMMKESKIHNNKLSMINIDSLHFKAKDLCGIMPSSCIIMDEVTASSHEIIEHLSCLQVKNIWCAGLFEEDKPITARSFTAHKMDVILRCPPIVQALLRHTEQDVKHQKPYRNNYQSSVLERDHMSIQRNNISEVVTVSNSDSDILTNGQNSSSESEGFGCLSKNRQDKNLYQEEANYLIMFNTKSGDHKDPVYSTILLDKRLQKKFGIIQPKLQQEQNTNQLEISSFTVSFNNKNVKNLFPDNIYSLIKQNFYKESCEDTNNYGLEFLNKYKNEVEKKEDKQHTSQPETQDYMSASELLNKRLCEKFTGGKTESENLLENNGLLLETSLTNANNLSDNEQGKKILDEQVLDNQYANNDCSETLLYDSYSLNKRLQEKYGKKISTSDKEINAKPKESINASYYRHKAEFILPTDGPRPLIIDHNSHFQPGNPSECSQCANELADFLEEMVIPESTPTQSAKKAIKVKKRQRLIMSSGISQIGKTGETVIFSNISSIHSKLPTFSVGQKHISSFDHRALNWSDVLIVANEMPKECSLVTTLRKRNIPVKVLMSGQTSEIENANENKLFITSSKEVTGLERSLIIFIPSESPHSLQNIKTTDIPDLHLGHSIQRFSEEDRMVLWYVASRSLASLVLILP